MTLREVVMNNLAPDAKTMQNNIDYLNKLAKKVPLQDQQKINAVTAGMKNQQAVQAKEEADKKAEENKPQQPVVQSKPQSTAQIDNSTATAQVDEKTSTAQF